MSGKNLSLLILSTCCAIVLAGCMSAPPSHTRQEILYEQGKLQKFAYSGDVYEQPGSAGAGRAPVLEALTVLKQCDPEALPQLADLPVLEPTAPPKSKKYTGLIQNLTNYDIADSIGQQRGYAVGAGP